MVFLIKPLKFPLNNSNNYSDNNNIFGKLQYIKPLVAYFLSKLIFHYVFAKTKILLFNRVFFLHFDKLLNNLIKYFISRF